MFNNFLEDAVRAVGERHAFNEKLSIALLSLKNKPSPNILENIVLFVSKQKLSASIAGVDSGFASKRLSFIDLVLIKTTGVLFKYKNGAQKEAVYYPAPFSFPKPALLKQGLEKDEEQQSVSLLRLREEINCAVEMIKKFKPNFMFLDGSIVPQYQDKPKKESELNDDYRSIISLFEKLYKVAEENCCTLVACVEDSRGARFCQILAEEILPKSSSVVSSKISPSQLNGSFDASLLDYYGTWDGG